MKKRILSIGLSCALLLSAGLSQVWASTGNPNAKPGASVAEHTEYRSLPDTPIPMRDGLLTYANIWMPEGEGPWPTILCANPYSNTYEFWLPFVERGYAFVYRSTTTRLGAEGIFELPILKEREDQYDTISWIADQDWSDGKVAAWGASVGGQTVLNAAASGHPNLVCAIPSITGENLWREWYWRGGAMELGFTTWWAGNSFAAHDAAELLSGQEYEDFMEVNALYSIDPASYLEVLPIIDFEPSAVTEEHNQFRLWASHPTYDDFWVLRSPETYVNSMNIPILHEGGWYDIFANGTVQAYIHAKNAAYTEFARDNQYLLMGPWWHVNREQTTTDEVIAKFGAGISSLDFENDVLFAFLDYWMKDLKHPGYDPEAHAVYYTTGAGGHWNYAEDWPPADAVPTNYYLNGGSSGTVASLNDGTLSANIPAAGTPSQTYVYDPMDPTPSRGGNTLWEFKWSEDGSEYPGPVEQGPVDARSLTFTSAPLEENLEVTGKITAVLYASSDAVDTDWVVRLNDVAPDGASTNIVDGILRARYRDSTTNPTLMDPGRIYEFHVDLWSTSHIFEKGHHLRVTVNSSSYPRWSRNMNVAEFPEQTTEWQVANNTIYLDAERPSHVILPVIPR